MKPCTVLVCFAGLAFAISSASPTVSADENYSPQYAQLPARDGQADASVYQRSSRPAPTAPDVVLAGATMDPRETVDPRGESEPARRSQFPQLLVTQDDGDSTTPRESKNQFAAPLVTVTSSLAVVLGLFAALVWVSRKYGTKTMGGAIPNEVIQTLGSTPIDPRTRVTMIRLGNRILVVAQTASGITPISEITDPEEVRNLTAHCIGDSKAQFSDALKSIEQEPTGEGFLGQPTAAPKARNRGSLFTTA